MNFLKLTSIILFLSMVFTACQKNKDLSPQPPVADTNVPKEKTIQGLWTGTYYGMDKSVPVHFSLLFKAAGQLDIVNAAQEVIGSGSWQLSGTQFKASLLFLSNAGVCTFSGELSDSRLRIEGVWGHDSSNTDGGFWNMDKMN